MIKTVLILCGGRSDEHEISLISAKHILAALDRKHFTPIVVGISKEGIWYLEKEHSFYVGHDRADKIGLNQQAPRVTIAPYTEHNGKGQLHTEAGSIEFDVVFPILHGPYGEDGRLQGMLDMIGIPYVGAGCGSSWICMDKVLTKTICRMNGIKIADFVCVLSLSDLNTKANEILNLGDTLFVKPARLGSSVGITKVEGQENLPKAVELALRYDSKVLIEQAIVGRELECGVLGLHREAKASLPGEIVPSPEIGFYSYEAKYILEDGAKLYAPADLDPKTTKAAQSFCLKTFDLLECDGMARIDFFLEKETDALVLNEVNTIPGFTPISMYPKLWQFCGVSYSELMTELISLAFRRTKR